MPPGPAAELAFSSWLRRGLAAGIQRVDGQGPPGFTTEVPLRLEFNDDQRTSPVLTLVGPGDIVGLDPRAIVRVFPPGDITDAEAGFFAGLELDQGDLPWRYTPARASGDAAADPATDQLRPWFTLVVLKESEIISLAPATASQKLPIVTALVANLPNLDDGWAWGHVQAKGAGNGGAPADIQRPGRVVARIFSPRRLDKKQAYFALLVPSYERGRLVGIGEKLDDRPPAPGQPDRRIDAQALAWNRATAGPTDTVALPVYFQWRFHTGDVGSFADLAAKLGPTPALPATVGRRDMDVSVPGLGFGPILTPPRPLAVGGALRSPAAKALDVAEETGAEPEHQDLRNDLDAFTTALTTFIEAATTQLGGRPMKIVVPPLYGRWYAGDDELDAPGSPPRNPPWFYKLNRHPRFRVAAGLGTRVIQREQQALMTSAWQQIDKLREINREKNSMQTALGKLKRLMNRHIETGTVEDKLTITADLHGKVFTSPTTVFGVLARSPLPLGLFDPQWRRLKSPQGVLGKRLGLRLLGPGQNPSLFDKVNSGALQIAPPPPTPADSFTPAAVFQPLVPAGLPRAQVDALTAKLGNAQLNFQGLVLFWVARHLLATRQTRLWWLGHKLLRLGLELIGLASPSGRAAFELADRLRSDTLGTVHVADGPRTQSFVAFEEEPTLANVRALSVPEVPGTPVAADSPDAALFRQAALGLTGYRARPRIDPPPLVRPSLPAVIASLMNGIRPELTLPDSIRGRHRILIEGFPWRNPDALERILAAPEFPQPMWQPLAAISPEWILPGIGALPANTVATLLPDQAFIEAYMVGLNHEMSRELLWNEYPVDQRNTYFFQFWDSRGFVVGGFDAVADRGPDGLKDIKPIRKWGPSPLGGNTSRNPSTEHLVLVVRGELVKHYPDFIAYAAEAKPDPLNAGRRVPDDNRHRFPVFQGRLGSDISFHGFDLSPAEVRANPGWFFILQEHAAAPRFGVPLGVTPGDRDVTPVDFPPPVPPPQPRPPATTSAQVALRGFKPPARVAIHGAELVP
jgi:hypothetical protein